MVPDVSMGAQFKPVSRDDDAYPGEVQPMGRGNFSQTREIIPDTRKKATITMKEVFLINVNHFS